MGKTTKERIMQHAKHVFATSGYEGLSMRTLAKQSGISLSVAYHYFKNKDALLKELFVATSRDLGKKRALLPKRQSATDMLRDRIAFQIDNVTDIVFILKYYMHFRSDYPQHEYGYLPLQATKHVTEVLEYGRATNEFIATQPIISEAKVITHSINGFLLEYYPTTPDASEKEALISSIHDFVMQAIVRQHIAKPMAKTLS